MFKKYRKAGRLYFVLIAGLLTIAVERAPAQAICVTSSDTACDEIDGRLELSGSQPNLTFTDIDSLPAGHDWGILINGSGGPFWGVADFDGGNVVFSIHGGAPVESLQIASDGNIGFGTSTPAEDLHIVDGAPRIRLEDDSGTLRTWQIEADDTGFVVHEQSAGSLAKPFIINPGASFGSLEIESNGDIGMGTGIPGPNAALHVRRNNGTAQLLVEEDSTTEASRTLLQLTNNGEAKFGFNNTAFARQWEFFASVGFSINEITNPGLEFVFTPTGNLNMTGMLTTGGPVCGGGCDELFQPGGEVESIEDHAAAMWENSHLPAVGPTRPDQPMNLSEKVGGLIAELEKAHIYIERLHEQLKQERRRNNSLEARLARLESLLPMRADD